MAPKPVENTAVATTELDARSNIEKVDEMPVAPTVQAGTTFKTPDEYHLDEYLKKAQALGISDPKELQALTEIFYKTQTFPPDKVTGMHTPDLLGETFDRAKQSNIGSLYVEADIGNLGGMNLALGRDNADKVFGEITKIFKEELQKAYPSATIVFFRNGGDEFSAVVVGVDTENALPATIQEKLGGIQRTVLERVSTMGEEVGMHDPEALLKLQHTKRPGVDEAGVGIYFAATPISTSPEHDLKSHRDVIDQRIIDAKAGRTETGMTWGQLRDDVLGTPLTEREMIKQRPLAPLHEPSAPRNPELLAQEMPTAQTFRTPHQQRGEDFMRLVEADPRLKGLSPAQLDELRPSSQLRKDIEAFGPKARVYLGEELNPTLDRLKADGISPVILGQADMANLGGMNKAFGTLGANQVLQKFGDRLIEKLQEVTPEPIIFRSGGTFHFVITHGHEKATVQETSKKLGEVLARFENEIREEMNREGISTPSGEDMIGNVPSKKGGAEWNGVAARTAHIPADFKRDDSKPETQYLDREIEYRVKSPASAQETQLASERRAYYNQLD